MTPGSLKKPVVWPDNFALISQLDLGIIVIGGYNEQEVARIICQKTRETLEKPRKRSSTGCPEIGEESHFRILRFRLNGSRYCLALQGFLIFDPPLESRSKKKGSKALYYGANKKNGLLLQKLPAHCRTSSHNHEESRWVEEYFLLDGQAELKTYGRRRQLKQYKLTPNNPVAPIIEPETIHQVSNTVKSSLILIRISGDSEWFDRWLTGGGHNFKKFPEF